MTVMTIVTLTTDFGLQDYYVGAAKGALLNAHPSLQIVDITHNIKNHDIVGAAYILKNVWQNFPEGTIHIVSVQNYSGNRGRFLSTYHRGHYFICPDNGIFSLVFEEKPEKVYELLFSGLRLKPIREVVAGAVGHIAKNLPFDTIGLEATDVVEKIAFHPVISSAQIRGTVIHIDQYENAILNITRALFDKVGRGRPFSLSFKRHDPITRLSHYYNDAPVGESLCIFNSDNLEIAINMGSASELLGIRIDDMVQIDFL